MSVMSLTIDRFRFLFSISKMFSIAILNLFFKEKERFLLYLVKLFKDLSSVIKKPNFRTPIVNWNLLPGEISGGNT